MRSVDFIDLGQMSFHEAWQLQSAVQQKLIDEKLACSSGEPERKRSNDVLFFVEHPHVFTLGKSGDMRNLLMTGDELQKHEAEFVKIDRGGDITYHGPGQIVAYPILDLDRYFTDIHKYLRCLEEVVIRTCRDFGIEADRVDGLTGVWVDNRKIAAFGVRCSRWVTMHGLALNVNPSLNYFSYIVPCGITDKNVTSMYEVLKREPDPDDVKLSLRSSFEQVFNVVLKTTNRVGNGIQAAKPVFSKSKYQ